MKGRGQTWFSWLFVCSLVILSAILGALQYRWIGEVSIAERQRLQDNLKSGLRRLSGNFNADLTGICAALLPRQVHPDPKQRERDYADRYAQWRQSTLRPEMVSGVSIAVPEGDGLALRRLNASPGEFEASAWPRDWERLRERLIERLRARHGGPPPGGAPAGDLTNVIEVPIFGGPGPGPGGRRGELEWVIVEFNVEFIGADILPALLRRHLGELEAGNYAAEAVMRGAGNAVLFRSGAPIEGVANADAAVRLFEVDFDALMRREPPGGPGRRRGPPRGEGMRRSPPGEFGGEERGKWELLVRHRAGSLEAVVSRARTRNLAVTAGILVLMMAAVAALVTYTRRAQHLAAIEMEFVAGVSHELRTPLSVMRTAGHNLRGAVADDPARVRRYGALIQDESEKLTAIVEQILQFAKGRNGEIIGGLQPASVEEVIDEAIAASRDAVRQSGCVVEKSIAPELPPILADAATLRHAFQNLLANAAKYASSGGWIGVSAASESDGSGTSVIIRVSDRGPGIPRDELGRVFEAFYRGKQGVAEQIHGTGLGLALTKRIIEAHHGQIAVASEPGRGTEFTIRLAANLVDLENDVTNTVDRG